MPDELEVGYSVKELIKGLSDRIDNFMALVSSKADQSSVTQVNMRLEGIDTRLLTVEHKLNSDDKHSANTREFRRWIVPTVISLLTVAVLIWQVLHP